MKKLLLNMRMALAIALIGVGGPLLAQQLSSPTKFLNALKNGKNNEAVQLLGEGSSTLINAQDDDTGEGALHIMVNKRATNWVRYLLQQGANVDIADKRKSTPLMLATQLGYIEGAEALITYKAKVDAQNRSGETALILAVHRNDRAMVRLLVKNGANPNKRDYTGQSAREYAERDPRAAAVLDVFVNGVGEDKPVTDEKKGDLNFSGIEDKAQ